MLFRSISHSAEIKDGLWISEPTATVFSNLLPEELMYYPVFNNQKIIALTRDLPRAKYIFYDGNALVCVPLNDKACEVSKENLLKKIKDGFELVYPDKILLFRDYGIFKKRTQEKLHRI